MGLIPKIGGGRGGQQPQRLRIGIFDDVTTRLLTNGVDKALQSAAVRRSNVDEIRQMLEAGDLEVALLPTWDFLQIDRLDVVPGSCMSTFGPGNIFMLFSKCLPSEIRRVLADQESFGARSLAHILLPSQSGVRPEITRSTVPLDPLKFDFARDPHDAYLIVGENALITNRASFAWVWDLGQAWQGLTQSPYVMHVWCCRRGVDLKGIDKELLAVAKQNASHPGEIVEKDAERLKVSTEMMATLYKSVLKVDFTAHEIAALRLYMKELVRSQTMPRPRQFNIYRPPMNMALARAGR